LSNTVAKAALAVFLGSRGLAKRMSLTTVEGGSIAVGKASTDSVVMSSVLILFSDLVLTQLLMG
jgi:ABC-type transporter Mla maintaining outer membrane lipid asymmetry permease subunit MlaE